MTPEGIQAVTSILTVLAALAAGFYARRAAIYTKNQAQASHRQVEIAADALEVTRGQAAAAEDHGNHQVEIARETLEVARKEAQSAQAAADRQVEEAKATYRRYEESKLDALIPVVLATVGKPRSFLETKEVSARGEWPTSWSSFDVPRNFEEIELATVVFRVRLRVLIENKSDRIARVEITDSARGEVDVPSGTPLIIPPHEKNGFTWTRVITPGMLATEDEINDPKNWLFDLTLWVRDLGMNVCDTYKFNSDLRLFSRDGSRLIVKPEPEHNWRTNVAQPLQQRLYQRLESARTMNVNLSGSGSLSASLSTGE
ncbi:hypothetical protein SAMN04487916_11748 [Arthrobacter sp. ov407]|uniref:hypothetical protein n=1 Tax=Arthrobacter sp. ov407 TaxID=1761748 RepID=UPI00088E1FE8|nr:hypothetical protein [Arthrobacter sp. ov407]SDL90102.1 hypothetical protein SAMN04487916_11748 [Arthrobacter sp. ov407]